MQIGKADGMITLDTSLATLLKEGVISQESARAKAHDPELVFNLAQQ